MSKLLDQVKKSVAGNRLADQNEEKGGYERTVIPAGTYPARFVGFVEVGNRDGGEWKGKKKADVRKAFAYFELLSKKLAEEIEVDGVKKTIYPVHREMLDVKTGEKANLTKLFKRMSAGRKLMHITEMLEEPFRVRIVHVVKEKTADKPETTYANIRTKDDGWLVFPPTFEKTDEETGETEVKKLKVMEQTVETKLLLWDDPTEEQWDSIFIDGTYTVTGKEGEADKEVSKNWMQEMIMKEALDFEGSPLQVLLASASLPDSASDIETGEDELPDEEPDTGPQSSDEEDMNAGDDDLEGLD